MLTFNKVVLKDGVGRFAIQYSSKDTTSWMNTTDVLYEKHVRTAYLPEDDKMTVTVFAFKRLVMDMIAAGTHPTGLTTFWDL